MNLKKIGVALLGVVLGLGTFAMVQAGGDNCSPKPGCCMPSACGGMK